MKYVAAEIAASCCTVSANTGLLLTPDYQLAQKGITWEPMKAHLV